MILESINFSKNSNNDGGSFLFTLTCTSSGGPATNVVWTRNSKVVTNGYKTVLNDSVTATYIHTLTVNERLGGLYQCNVSNNKPSHDSSKITVQGAIL